jgi:hypothetical protein
MTAFGLLAVLALAIILIAYHFAVVIAAAFAFIALIEKKFPPFDKGRRVKSGRT